MYGDFEIMKEKNIMFVQIKAIRKGTKPPIWRAGAVRDVLHSPFCGAAAQS